MCAVKIYHAIDMMSAMRYRIKSLYLANKAYLLLYPLTITESISKEDTLMRYKTAYTSRQMVAFSELLEELGVTPDRFNTALDTGALAAVFDPSAHLKDCSAIRLALRLHIMLPDVFHFTVDAAKTSDQMIDECRFEWPREEISDVVGKFHFGDVGKTVGCTGRLISFGRKVKPGEVSNATGLIKPANWFSLATIKHTLAFAAAYPEVQRQYLIMGLGSVADFGRQNRRFRAAPQLGADAARGRYLYRVGVDGSIDKWYWFLIVHEDVS